MIAALEAAGWRYTEDPERAALIIVNSCGFILPAKEESIEAVMAARRRYPRKRILLAGCLAQRYAAALSSDLPEVDGIFGNRAPERVAEVVEAVMAGGRPVLLPGGGRPTALPAKRGGAEGRVRAGSVPGRIAGRGIAVEADDPADGGLPPANGEALLRRRLLSLPGSAYVKIAEGCRNRCTYCAIPSIRGGLVSRPIDEVEREVRALAASGIREIILVAQDSASYGLERTRGPRLERLLERLLAIEGDFWLRLLYLHPDRIDFDMMRLFAAEPRLLPYFDLPFQHADSSVLRRMGRSGSSSSYLRLIEEIRNRLPSAAVRSTFLVGFPGEGAAEFEELLRFQERAELDWLGVFAFSREEGTKAFGMRAPAGKGVTRAEVLRRVSAVEQAQLPITERRLDRFLGRELEVLLEERIEGEPLAIGRAYLHAPEVDGAVVIRGEGLRLVPGERIACRIVRRNGVDLEALPIAVSG